MIWTTEKPTQEGWYWWRVDEYAEPEIGHVVQEETGEIVVLWTTDTPDCCLVSDLSGQWAGPILHPEEP